MARSKWGDEDRDGIQRGGHGRREYAAHEQLFFGFRRTIELMTNRVRKARDAS